MILLIMYVVTGIALIGIALFKKIVVAEGERIDNFKQYKLVYTLTNILFGLIFLGLAAMYYFGKVSGYILFATIPVVEILQRLINNYYIKDADPNEEEKCTSKLAEEIDLDEILEEDFFEKNKQIENNEKEDKEELEKKTREKHRKKINELLMEGIELGILKTEVENDVVKVSGKGFIKVKEVKELQEILDSVSEEESNNGEVIEVDFTKK